MGAALTGASFQRSLSAPVPPGGGEATLRSSSGQFVVAGPVPTTAVPARSVSDTNLPSLVALDAATLVLTCERTKRALLTELGTADGWRGRIYVVINPAMTNNQAVVIGAQAFRQGWHYRMEVPPQLEATRLTRALVEVLLLEMANRRAGMRSAEIPLWLSEGLTLHIVRSSLIDLVVEPPRETLNQVAVRASARQARRPDPLAEVRERLQTHAAFSLARLGEVTADRSATETWATFQASAHLFVHELLLLPGGRSFLADMIGRLSTVLNWQAAFLAAFQPVFPRLLDAEKWWSVVLVRFTGLDPLNAWSIELALEKLDDVLHPPVLMSAKAADAPRREKPALQQILRDWDYLRQRLVLRGVETQLGALRVKMPPELVELTDQYRAAISDYLRRRDRWGVPRDESAPPAGSTPLLVKSTLQELDRLDERRRMLGGARADGARPASTGRVSGR